MVLLEQFPRAKQNKTKQNKNKKKNKKKIRTIGNYKNEDHTGYNMVKISQNNQNTYWLWDSRESTS